MIALAFCLQVLSMYLFALSKDKHFKQLFQRFPTSREVIGIRVSVTLFCAMGVYLCLPLGWAILSLYSLSQIAIAIAIASVLHSLHSKVGFLSLFQSGKSKSIGCCVKNPRF